LKLEKIDGDAPENQNPVKQLDEGEFIDVLLIPMDSILETLEELHRQGYGIDGKIWMTGYGYQKLQNFVNKPIGKP
jgi:hypothetical protein